jgi:hypothetical protein
MTTERRNQRDLFEQATMPRELSSDLRTALTPLLRVLLTEAEGNHGPKRRSICKIDAVSTA